MTVQELINQLQQFEPNDEVHFSYNYGDHCRTTVAPKARVVDLMGIVESEYHGMPMIVDEEDNRYDEAKQVVIIS